MAEAAVPDPGRSLHSEGRVRVPSLPRVAKQSRPSMRYGFQRDQPARNRSRSDRCSRRKHAPDDYDAVKYDFFPGQILLLHFHF